MDYTEETQDSRFHRLCSPSGHHRRGWKGAWCVFSLTRRMCELCIFTHFYAQKLYVLFSVQKLLDTSVLPTRKALSDVGLSPAAGFVFAEFPERRTFPGTRPLTARRDGPGDAGRRVGGNYRSRRAPRADTMRPCRHPGRGAARPGRAAGCRSGSRPGRRALLGRENCSSRHALPRARLPTGQIAPGSGLV